ncbi:MAG: hypothetical protein PHE49_04630, partial [bacterium]|nr:hypothetical protein [bacterium]
STSDSSFYMPKKKEWYDVKESVFGENQVDTTLQDSGTYSEGRIDGTKACKGNEMLVGAAVGVLLSAFGYAYPFVFVSGEPPYEIKNSIDNKGEDYKKGFLKGYRRKKKTNALMGTTGGCIAGYLGYCIFVMTIFNSGY